MYFKNDSRKVLCLQVHIKFSNTIKIELPDVTVYNTVLTSETWFAKPTSKRVQPKNLRPLTSPFNSATGPFYGVTEKTILNAKIMC